MRRNDLPPAARRIWQVAVVVRGVQGLLLGIEIYIWGPLFYEQLVRVTEPALAIGLTTILFGIESFLRALFEIPTGAFGDVVGRKWSVVGAFGCRAVNLLLLAAVPFATSFPAILGLGLAANVGFALYDTLFSGSFTAWCVDQLRTVAPGVGYERVLAPAQSWNALAKFGGAALGIGLFVAGVPWMAFLAGSVGAAALLIYCLSEMVDDRQTAAVWGDAGMDLPRITAEMGAIIGTAVRVFRQSRILLVVTVLFASYWSVFTLISLLWPIYLRATMPEAPQFVAWLTIAFLTQCSEAGGAHGLATWAARTRAGMGRRNLQLSGLLIGASLVAGMAVLGLNLAARFGYESLWLFVVTAVLVKFGYGLAFPSYETLINNYIPDANARERATVLSCGSFINGLMVLCLAVPAAGPSGAETILGWGVPAGWLLLVTFVSYLILRRAQRSAPLLQCAHDTVATSIATSTTEEPA